MPLDEQEIIQDLPNAIALFYSVKAAVNSLPKTGKASIETYVRAFGAVEDSPLVRLAQLLDALVEQSKT